MSSYTRSEDVSVRKSPSVSATLYQVGTKKTGNDGNLWIIVRDSRGVQRWQKYSGYEAPKHKINVIEEPKIIVTPAPKTEEQFLNGIKNSLEGLKILIEDEPELKSSIEEKVKKRIDALDILAEDGDESAIKASKIMKDFLKESFKFGGKIKKREADEEFYENALRNAKRQSDREYFIKKLNELDNQKTRFN
jgi:hypothetical protein